jgi:hypothetical protein
MLRAKREAMEAILPAVHGQEPVPEDIESFLLNVSRGGIGGVSKSSFIADHAFRDFLATGNLRLIGDSEVRDKISQYYGYSDFSFERARGRHTKYVSFVHTVIPAELREDVDLAAYESFGIDYALMF